MKIFSTAFVTAIAIQLGSASITQAETLKISTFLPPQHAFNRALHAWGEELSEKSEGDLRLRSFQPGNLDRRRVNSISFAAAVLTCR